MGARNLVTENTSKTYIVEKDEFEGWDYVLEFLDEKLKETNMSNHRGDSEILNPYDRNFAETSTETRLELWKEYKFGFVYLYLTPLVRDSYQTIEGTLDYKLHIEIADEELEMEGIDSTNIAELLVCYTDLTPKESIRYGEWIETWYEKTSTEMIDVAEKVFETCSTPWNCIASASNGESFYTKA